jgi:MoaA/NifB/PqqE/SkfB family radical SAM enzyme
MNEYLRYKHLHSISRFNILPVTSRCNFCCVFCSHRQNPPDLETILVPDLTSHELDDILCLLDPCRKIVIGESATRCIEGEPFCNPSLMDILAIIRKKFRQTPIHIATNGSLLDAGTLKLLEALRGKSFMELGNATGAEVALLF